VRDLGIPSNATIDQLTGIQNTLVSGFKEQAKPWYSDQILPFDITLCGTNEQGSATTMKIFGVEILNAGSGVSIDDAVQEMQATFVARFVEPCRLTHHARTLFFVYHLVVRCEEKNPHARARTDLGPRAFHRWCGTLMPGSCRISSGTGGRAFQWAWVCAGILGARQPTAGTSPHWTDGLFTGLQEVEEAGARSLSRRKKSSAGARQMGSRKNGGRAWF
jgi:hypothetical protein